MRKLSKSLLLATMIVTGWTFIAALSTVSAQETTLLRLGTSSRGAYYPLGVGIASVVIKNSPLKMTVETVGGSTANLFAIAKDRIDFAVVNAHAALNALNGTGKFKKAVDVKLIAQGQSSLRQILVRKGAGITKPEDLIGKTIIGIRPANPDLEQITKALLAVYKISESQLKIVATSSTKEAMTALKTGTVDAAVLPGSRGAASIRKLFNDDIVDYLEIPKDKQEQMLTYLPKSLTAYTLPAKAYVNQEKAANVFAIKTLLVVSGNVSDDVVYMVTKALMENLDQFKTVHRAAKKWTLKNTLNNPMLPFHPGANRYFLEIGAK